MAGQAPDTPSARVDANVRSSPWSGAVSVVVDGSAYSGVVIGARHVLTASHVAAGHAPSTVQVVVNLAAAGQTIAVTNVATYPGAAFPYDDLTVLRLAQAVPAGTAIYPIVDNPYPTGTQITLVGYGASGNGNTGPSVPGSASVKRIGKNVLDQYTDRLDASGRTSPFFLYDFDGPSGAGQLGGPTLGNATETCVAGGDSGSGVDGSYWLNAVPDLSNFYVPVQGSIYGDDPNPKVTEFNKKYKDVTKGDPSSQYVYPGYVLIDVWAKAVERAKTTDAAPVVAELEKMKSEATLFGPRTFSKDLHHQNQGRYLIVDTEQGKPRVVDQWTISEKIPVDYLVSK